MLKFLYENIYMKILFTGGHLSPALALIDEIKYQKINAEIIFVGRKYALDSENTLSLEYKEIKKRNIRFIPLTAGRLTRILSFKSLKSFLKIPIGFIKGFFIIKNEKPEIIFSFGSYLALPIVFWGYFFKIPIFTHEQTIKPGIANKIIGFFAKKIFLAFPQAKKYFSEKKVVLVGNPLKKNIFQEIKKPFLIKKDKPVIYITGGSLGSHSINKHIKKIIKKLLKNYIVIHQTGETKEYHDFEDLLKIKNSLNKELSDNYYLRKHFFDEEIGYVYKKADLVVGRSGANTFFELLALKKPALFIPLPWSAGKEQQHHAEIFAKNQIGEIFHQIQPSEKLLRLIKKMIDNLDFYKKNFNNLDSFLKKDATKEIISQVFKNI